MVLGLRLDASRQRTYDVVLGLRLDASRQRTHDVVLGLRLELTCLRSAVASFRCFAQRALELHVVEFDGARLNCT